MSAWFAVAIIAGVIALFFGGYAIFGARSKEAETGSIGIGAVFLVVAVVLTLIAAGTTIEARSVGVKVSFGKASDEPLRNGLNWHDPWATVEEFDASLQPMNLSDNGDDGCQGVTVRMASSTTACADVSLQWNIDAAGDEAVVELYRTYKTFDRLRDNLVYRQLVRVLNQAFETYDPLAAIKQGETGTGSAMTLTKVATKAQTDLQTAVGSAIKIASLNIPLVHFDGDTEGRLKAYQQALADTRIAEQKKITAEKTRLAAEELTKSKAIQDKGVQFQNCLDFMKDLSVKGQLNQLPATFQCPGSDGGSGALVQIPAK